MWPDPHDPDQRNPSIPMRILVGPEWQQHLSILVPEAIVNKFFINTLSQEGSKLEILDFFKKHGRLQILSTYSEVHEHFK